MKKYVLLLPALFCLLFSAKAQTCMIENTIVSPAYSLPAKTQITLELMENLSTRTAQPGQMVRLMVYKDVKVGGMALIRDRTEAEGRITRVRRPGPFGRPGMLMVQVLSLTTVDGQTVYFSDGAFGYLYAEGHSRFGIALPLTFLGVLVKGSHAELNSGEMMVAKTRHAVTVQ